MRFTVKDLLIFIVVMGIVYYSFYGPKFSNRPPKKTKAPREIVVPTKLPKLKEPKIIVRTNPDRPQVDEPPVFAPEKFEAEHGSISYKDNGQKTIATVVRGNTIPVRTERRSSKVRRVDEQTRIKRKQLMQAYAQDKITKEEFETQMKALAQPLPKLDPLPQEKNYSNQSLNFNKKLLEKERYASYLKECIQEQLPADFRDIYSYIIFAVNQDGTLAYSTVMTESLKNQSLALKRRDKLLIALENAAPFQPFPYIIDEEVCLYSMNLRNGNLTVYNFSGAPPLPEIKYPPSNKQPNPKKVADVKVSKSLISLMGLDEEGRIVFRRLIYRPVDWVPITYKNNTVRINFTVKEGKLVHPVFKEKSDILEANDAALRAMYSLKLPSLSAYEQYPTLKIEGLFTVE